MSNTPPTHPRRPKRASQQDRLGLRLVRLTRTYHKCWRRYDRIQAALESLTRARYWVVAGETKLLAALRAALEAARSMLHDDLRERFDDNVLEQVEALLEDPVWDVADEVGDDLEGKLRDQEEFIRSRTEQVADWQALVSEIRARLEAARKLRAPVLRQENEFRQLEAAVAQADRFLKEPSFAQLDNSLEQLRKTEAQSRQMVPLLSEREKEGARFIHQAELMLLLRPGSAASVERLHYNVVLRTPSEPDTQGVNIQGSTTVVQQDSRELRDFLKRVTTAVNLGLTRGFESAQKAGEGVAGGTRTFTSAPVAGRVAVPPPRLSELIRDVGDLMFRLIVPEQMQTYLADFPCSLTITTNDLELPWELMYTQAGFLCLTKPVTRMPLGQALPRRPRLRTDRPPKLRFLLIYADPEGTLPLAQREIDGIADRLQKEWGNRIEVEKVVLQGASGRRLNEALRKGQFDVIHYAGHASFDEKDGDLSGLLLHEKEVFFAQKVRRLLEGRPLVFLNACESGFTANERQAQQLDRYLQVPAEGLASAFIYGGAVACIGSVWPVFDGPAAEFAVSFYNRVLEGHPIGEAMRLTRNDSFQAHPEQITWSTFVLYGDPRFRLVD